MANVVEIVIRVENAQAVGAMKSTTAALKDIGVEGQTSMRQLADSTGEAAPPMDALGLATKRMGGHATTSLDGVRLLSQEFGLRLPRALEAMLSRMPAVTAALGGVVSGLAGVAIAEVFYRAGEAAYNLYQKYISLSAVAEDYQKIVQQHRDEDFVNPHSIEVTVDRINQATAAAEKFQSVSKQLSSAGWEDMGNAFLGGNLFLAARGAKSLYDAHSDAQSGNKSQEQADELRLKHIDQERDLARLRVEDDHATDAALQSEKKRTAELEKQKALLRVDRTADNDRDSILQKYGLRSGGEEKEQRGDSIASKKADAERITEQREITEKTIGMHNEAVNAGLRGNALYLAQRNEAEATIRRSATGTETEIAAVRLKYFNEQKARTLELTELAADAADAARRVGLEGVPAIAAELTAKLAKIQAMQEKTSGDAPLTTGQNNAFSSMRNSANQESFAKRAKMDADYTEYVDAQVARRADTEIGAFAKVAAAQARERLEAQQKYSKSYVTGAGVDLGSDTNQADRARELLSIDQNAAAERRKLEEDLNQRTLQMDTEADQAERRIRGSGLDAWVQNYRSSIVAIEAARDQLRVKIDREESQPGVTDAAHAQFERQKVDADRKANAQIVELNQGMRQQLANNLQGAFDDPVHYIQNKMKAMFFQMLADWLLQTEAFKSTFGTLMGGLHIGGAGGILGTGGSSTAHSMGIGQAVAQVSGTGVPASAGSSIGASSGTASAGSAFSGGSGTISQALAAPGSGTAAMTPFSALGDASTLAQTGMTAAAALSGASGSSDSEAAAAHEAAHTLSLGDDDATAAATGLGSAMGLVGAGFGAYTGTKGIISAFEGGKPSDILSGASSGAAMGASIGMFGGPVGAAIGAGIGAVGGATAGLVGWASGEGNRLQAKKYYKSSILPQMEEAEKTYLAGSGTSDAALSSINSIAAQGFNAIATQSGRSAAEWAKATYIDKERTFLEGQIESLAKGGRDYTSMSAAQFHAGGLISGFGDLGTSSNEGFIHAMLGETVVNPTASSAHGPAISAMNGGASEAEIAAMYLRASGSSGSMPSGGDTIHNHKWEVNAVDADSFRKMLRSGGGAAVVSQELDKYVTRYAGDAASG